MKLADFFKNIVASREKKLIQNKKRLPKPPRPQFPKAIERDYEKQLVEYSRVIQREIRDRLFKIIPLILKEANANKPGAKLDAWFDDIDQTIESVRIETDRAYTDAELEAIARRKGISISDFQKEQQRRQLKTVLNIDVLQKEPWLKDKINAFAVQNVGLIKSIQTKLLEDVRNEVFQAVNTGLTSDELASNIEKRFGVSESKAEFIARDQTAKLNSQLEQARQEDLGVEEYTWSTSLDERVRGNPAGKYPNARPSHWDKEGKTFRWDDPPADTGHPGESYNCRCVALPNYEKILQEE